MNDLKIPHCPFCAGDAAIQVDGATYQIKRVYCECKSCGSRGKAVAFGFVWKNFEMAKKEAIEHWSMRKPIENIIERIEGKYLFEINTYKEYLDGEAYRRSILLDEVMEIIKKERHIQNE